MLIGKEDLEQELNTIFKKEKNMKKLLLLGVTLTIFIACDKDKNLPDEEYSLEIQNENKNIDKGLEVGQVYELVYNLKKNYNEEIKDVEYELFSDKTGFIAEDNQGNRVELNKKYLLKQNPLKIRYKATEKGLHNVKVRFTNSKKFSVEKNTSLNFDGYGAYFTLNEKEETIIGDYLPIEYEVFGYDNKKTSNLIVNVVEDEADGGFFWQKGGQLFAKKGDSFEIVPSENKQTLYYRTYNVTPERKISKIILKVKPKEGNGQEQTITLYQKFINNNLELIAGQVQGANKISLTLKSDIPNDNNIYLSRIITSTKELEVKRGFYRAIFNDEPRIEEKLINDIDLFFEDQRKSNFGSFFLKANKEYTIEVRDLMRREEFKINILNYNAKDSYQIKKMYDEIPSRKFTDLELDDNFYSVKDFSFAEKKKNIFKDFDFNISIWTERHPIAKGYILVEEKFYWKIDNASFPENTKKYKIEMTITNGNIESSKIFPNPNKTENYFRTKGKIPFENLHQGYQNRYAWLAFAGGGYFLKISIFNDEDKEIASFFKEFTFNKTHIITFKEFTIR